jgi:hypothetical protein
MRSMAAGNDGPRNSGGRLVRWWGTLELWLRTTVGRRRRSGVTWLDWGMVRSGSHRGGLTAKKRTRRLGASS